MTRDLDLQESPAEVRRRRTFRVRTWVGVGGLLLAEAALLVWGGPRDVSPWRPVLAVLPLLPVAWIVVVVALRARQLDEYQVKLLFPGVAVGFGAAMIVGVTVGSLSAVGLFPANGGWVVCLAGLLAWAITNVAVGAPRA